MYFIQLLNGGIISSLYIFIKQKRIFLKLSDKLQAEKLEIFPLVKGKS